MHSTPALALSGKGDVPFNLYVVYDHAPKNTRTPIPTPSHGDKHPRLSHHVIEFNSKLFALKHELRKIVGPYLVHATDSVGETKRNLWALSMNGTRFHQRVFPNQSLCVWVDDGDGGGGGEGGRGGLEGTNVGNHNQTVHPIEVLWDQREDRESWARCHNIRGGCGGYPGVVPLFEDPCVRSTGAWGTCTEAC